MTKLILLLLLIVAAGALQPLFSGKHITCYETPPAFEPHKALYKFSNGGSKFYGLKRDTGSDDESDASSEYMSLPESLEIQGTDSRMQTSSLKKAMGFPEPPKLLHRLETKSEVAEPLIGSVEDSGGHEVTDEVSGVNATPTPTHTRTRFARLNDIRPLHDNDLKIVNVVKSRLSGVFAGLVRLTEDLTEDNQSSLKGLDEVLSEYEGKLGEIDTEVQRITTTGNLFRADVSDLLDRTKSMFQLLRYREALKLRYGTESLGGGTKAESPMHQHSFQIGIFGLKVVELQLSLFSLYVEEAGSMDSASPYQTKVSGAEARLGSLVQDFRQMESENVQYASYFELELIKLIDAVHDFKHGITV